MDRKPLGRTIPSDIVIAGAARTHRRRSTARSRASPPPTSARSPSAAATRAGVGAEVDEAVHPPAAA